MSTKETADMKVIRDWLMAQRDKAQTLLDALEADVEVARNTVASMERGLEMAGGGASSNGRHSDVTVSDVRGCKTQRDIARRAAELSGGVVNVTKVALLIHATGRWGAKESSLKSTMNSFFCKHTDEWEWVEPGTFRWKRFNQ